MVAYHNKALYMGLNVSYCINDLETRVPLYKYVDDSTLFEICYFNDVSVMQESTDSAVNWTIWNDMKINSEKSKEMIISFTQYVNLGISVPNIVIEPVEQVIGTTYRII